MHRIMQETYIIFLLIDILVFIFPVSSVGYCVSGTVLHTSDGGPILEQDMALDVT